jgi:hypothetical protein
MNLGLVAGYVERIYMYSCRIRGMIPNTFTLYVEGGQSSDRFSLSIVAENAEGIWSPWPKTRNETACAQRALNKLCKIAEYEKLP